MPDSVHQIFFERDTDGDMGLVYENPIAGWTSL